MARRGLLSRLAATTVADARSVDPVESVLEHLRVLLNARRGGAETRDDYGVPDFTDALHAMPSGALDVCESLRATIAKYEPRLQNVTVKPAPIDGVALTLQFEVSGRLVLPNQRRPVRFSTRISPGGHVEIE